MFSQIRPQTLCFVIARTVEVLLLELCCRFDCKCIFFLIILEQEAADPYGESRESESKFTAIYT